LGWFETAGFPKKKGGAKTLFILFISNLFPYFQNTNPNHQLRIGLLMGLASGFELGMGDLRNWIFEQQLHNTYQTVLVPTPTRWCPPVINGLYNPIKYRYITNQP